MNCAQAKRYMPGYLDGAISASSHAGIRAHVAECRECFGELENYSRLSHCLSSVGPVAPPADLALRIRLRGQGLRATGGRTKAAVAGSRIES